MDTFYKIISLLRISPALLIAIMVFVPCASMGQGVERIPPEPEMRKWSFSIYGGTVMGRSGTGLTPFTGSTGSRTAWINPHVGGSIEYMVTPSFAIAADYTYSIIENDSDDPSFKNEHHSISLATNIYIMNLFDSNRETSWFNPYLSLFAGNSHSSYSNIQGVADYSNWRGHFGYSLGTKIRLGDYIDWKLAYQYKFYNPWMKVDGGAGRPGIYENDRLAGFVTGLSIKLGKADRGPHARWYSPVQAVQEWRQEMDQLVKLRESQWSDLLNRMDRQEARLEQLEREMQNKADKSTLTETQRAIAALEARVAELEARLGENLERIDEIHRAAGIAHLTTDVVPGYYVQTFAAWSARITQRALDMTRHGLKEQGYNVDEMNFFLYQIPNGLYTVQIGPFPGFTAARQVLPGAIEVFDDSFIRTIDEK